MGTAQLVVLTLVFGLLVGAVFALLLRAAKDRGSAAIDLVDQRLPDGIAAVLGALEGPAIVLDGSNSVLLSTPAATALGLVGGRVLHHDELGALVDEARAAHAARTRDLLLRRGTVGPPTLHVAARAAPVGLSHVLLLVEDRSDVVRLEAVRRDFVANVSHELKTPIGAVGLLAEALDSAADDPDQVRRFAARLTSEATRLAHITREIIDFSRIQSRDPLHQPRPVSLDDVAERGRRPQPGAGRGEVHRGRRRQALRRARARRRDAADHRRAQPRRERPAVLRPERPRRHRRAVPATGSSRSSVTDQGAGIPEDEVDRVFERFYRGDPGPVPPDRRHRNRPRPQHRQAHRGEPRR